LVACLAIVDRRRDPAGVWLIDATPDISRQLALLAPVLRAHPQRPGRLRPPDAIFLTHGHMGHIAGLVHLGPEVMAVHGVHVYASAGLVRLLAENRLWRPMVERLRLQPLTSGQPVELGPALRLTAIPVPHRDEWGAGTFAFRIDGPERSLLYLPDIDAWEGWPEGREVISGCAVALVDGTFFSAGELAGRPPVAHPLVPDTLALWRGLPTRLVLTHLNHTNPLLDAGSQARREVVAVGAEVAKSGQFFDLGHAA
jgi:pyrroloquinoline quinone biosynthesis protein B